MSTLKCLPWGASITLEEYLNYQKPSKIIVGKQGVYSQGAHTWVETVIRALPGRDSSRNGELVAFEYSKAQFRYQMTLLDAVEYSKETTEILSQANLLAECPHLQQRINLSIAKRKTRLAKYSHNKFRRDAGIPPKRIPLP